MVKYENQCCGCAVPGYPCRGDVCSNQNVPVLYCDACGEEVDDLFEWEGEEWCIDCIMQQVMDNLVKIEY